ncbi:MBL fold metallo-hydrolase RNA specificity domain-containing protein [Mycoplasma zalophidermidis]|uniref:Ribonuclease J n=1 Tax=Mycoplasma zalophidermidis TaxID=398174 RepID=A0ABS6DSF4_9MOLU|nr:ribonuclease J [Mycoplasma zalophidermidis]MBU4689486.1 ribonuclease J [Mycoplasma zalophidermidis]MBU4693364.1 ribonuclease J [Mycoplasma zalophidermidis]MCR8966338.1 ribonuclease J [Mycoplasma zalophidermidis]
MNHINIFALGGLDENGKNCYVLEYNEKIYIINAGTKVPINSQNGVDTLIPDFSYLEKNKDKIVGVFVTDVKNETFSALPWLLMHIPNLNIYTSPFNKIMIADRLSKYKIMNKDYKIISLSKMAKLGEIFVQPIELAGSMPGHIGFDFITPDGDVLFMFNFVEGNLGIYGKLDFQHLKTGFTKRKLIALVVDSGRANYSGKAVDKINLPESIKDVFMSAKENERIIIGAYDEEMVSIHQILELAIKTNRPIITYGKTYGQLFYLMQKENPNLKLPEQIDYKMANKSDNAVVLVTGAIERLYSRFLRITDNNDVFLKLKPTDNVIMIAPPIAGLESIAAVSLDDIARITPKISDVSNKEFYRHRPARQDLIDLVKTLQPQYVIPVQGLYRYLSEAAKCISKEAKIKPQNCILLQNGKIAHFINGKLSSTKGKIKGIGDVIIDGFGIGDISTEVIAEREILGRDGAIIITSTYNSNTKKLTGRTQINIIGAISKEDKKEAEELIISTIVSLLETEEFEGLKDFQNRARHVIRKRIFKTFNKEPMIIVSLNQN